MKETKTILNILAIFFSLSFFILSFQIIKANNCSGIDTTCTIQTDQACQPPVGSPTTYTNTSVSPPQVCTPRYHQTVTTTYVVDGSGIETVQSTSATSCQIDNGSLQGCQNTAPPQCNTDSDCGTNDACNTFTCVTTSQTNPVYNGTNNYFIKYCSRNNLCSAGSSGYCGDGLCNNSETNSTCATDCPNVGYCGTPASTSMNYTAWIYEGLQGDLINLQYRVFTSNAFGEQQTFSCPSGNKCGWPPTSTNPQIYNNNYDATEPNNTFSYFVTTTILGSQSINYTQTATASNAACANPSDTGIKGIFAYRGDPFNVNVTNTNFCGGLYITWSGYNQDDLYNVIRAPASNPGLLTTIATNVNRTYYVDTAVTPGTKYLYYIQIANRQSGWIGSPTLVWAQQNYSPTSGVAPVACPSAALSASPTTVTSGSSSTLTWTTTGVNSCSSVGANAMPAAAWSGSSSTGNVSTGALASSRSYQIRCTGAGGTVTSPVANVTVVNLPTVSLTANPTSIASNASSTIGWTITNATSCSNIGADAIPNANWTTGANGNVSTGVITTSKSYRLSCTGPGGTTQSNTVTVTIVPAPTVSLTATPSSVPSGGSSTIGWTVTNATSCSNIGANSIPAGSWSTGTTGSVSSGALIASRTYRLSCTGVGGTTQSNSVTVSIIPAPTVSIGVSATSVPSGGSSTISWTVANATSCSNIGADAIPNANWTTGTTGNVSSGALTSSKTYRLSCTGGGGTTQSNTVSITVTVNNPNPGGVCNSTSCDLIPPSGASYTTCSSGMVRLFWTDNSTNETSFKIYRDGAFVTSTTSANTAGTGTDIVFNYSPGDTLTHSYSVSAANASSESGQAVLSSGIAVVGCTPVLTGSDKDITAVNGTNIGSPTSCNGLTQALPSSVTLQNADKLSFAINICNTGTATATSISITDRMINLSQPSSGWNVKLNGTAISTYGGSVSVSGSSPNQTLTINLGTAQVGPGGVGTVTLDAVLTKPSGFSGNSARFQNSFTINATGVSGSGSTPLLPFYTGSGSPIIIEVP